MEAIRSWWQVPCIAHFSYVFSKPFKLPEFDIEELEDTLLLDEPTEDPTPSLLVQLYCSLLNGIVDKDVTEENWEFFLKMHLEWRCEYLQQKWNPHKDKEYKQLSTREKVDILHQLCHWRLELDDIGELLRGCDGPSLRVEPLGRDDSLSTYWYFYGTRLYKEVQKKRSKKDTSTPKREKGKGKGKGSAKKQGTNRNSRQGENEEDKDAKKGEEDQEEEGWMIVCSTTEEWEEAVEALKDSKRHESKQLYHYLNEVLLPDVLLTLQAKEKIFKKKLMMEMPRRTSDRLALKALQRVEEERMRAQERELQREQQRRLDAEELKRREEEAEEKRQKKRDDAINRKRAREEQQQKVRQDEEKNWTLALSGELSGPRRAAIGAVKGVVETQHMFEDEHDEEMYTSMYKVLNSLRKLEDAWIFEDPVTEDIAPGYFEVVKNPMDFATIEKKLEKREYLSTEQYNGEESEYAEMSDEFDSVFQKLMKKHFVTGDAAEEEDGGRKKKKASGGEAYPSPTHSPDLTSESSEEEESSEEDDSYEGPRKVKANRSKKLALPSQPQQPFPVGGMPRPMFPPGHMYRPRPPGQWLPFPSPPPHMMQYPPPYAHPPLPYPPHHHYPPMPHPHEQHFLPPEAYRYPYPPHPGVPLPPPPPYRPPMIPPQGMPPNPPPQSAGTPPPRLPVQNGHEHERAAEQKREENLQPQKQPQKDEEGEEEEDISSPLVSSTVHSPPEKHRPEKEEEKEAKGRKGGEKEEEVEGETTNEGGGRHHGGEQLQAIPSSVHPIPRMRPGQHPYPQRPYPPMSEQEYRYHQAMMAQRYGHPYGAPGYPQPPHSFHPDEAYYSWAGQRHGYPDPHQYSPGMMPHPHLAADAERRRREMAAAIMHQRQQQHQQQQQAQAKMNNRGAAVNGAPGGGSEKEEYQDGPLAPSSAPEDIPDYHDSLTRYALELASSSDGEEQSSREPQETKQPPAQSNPGAGRGGEGGGGGGSAPTSHPPPPGPSPHHQPPYPPQHKHAIPNGYPVGRHPYPPGRHPYPPYMYGAPYPHPMSYYPHTPPHDAQHRPMSAEEIQRWRYAEMQRRQWLHRQQQQQQQLHSLPTPPDHTPSQSSKRPPPPEDAQPPPKQVKTAEDSTDQS